jgi:hypothetical protein
LEEVSLMVGLEILLVAAVIVGLRALAQFVSVLIDALARFMAMGIIIAVVIVVLAAIASRRGPI